MRDFVSVISYRCFHLKIGFGDIAPVNEENRVFERREELRVCVKERDVVCVCEREREREKRPQQPRFNTEYAHASVSFKFPWVSPIELNK